MHQTFYIDADEEISSVIDRLNKSMSSENYFVVPKRAIFLQSIVNLKLLKREADKLDKHLVIVTQDEIGASMAQRSGLEVKHTIEGLEPAEIDEILQNDESEEELDSQDYEAVSMDEHHDKKSRLNSVGSSDFYDVMENLGRQNKKSIPATKSQVKKVAINGVFAKEKNRQELDEKKTRHPAGKTLQKNTDMRKSPKAVSAFSYGNKIDPGKEKTLEKMFSAAKPQEKKIEQHVLPMNGVAKKILIGFIVLCLLALAGVATYLFLPSAKVIITPNVSNEKVDVVVNGSGDVSQVEQVNMPIRIVEKEESVSLSYDVLGASSSVGKKAHGKVVIYNEFNSSPQTLVATTRLESSDGKIFRIVKNVVVPGTTTVGAETKPGAIEAEVVADKAGSEFNIAPASFTVPGFKDSPKYAKFYAKSSESFIGGSSEGGSTPGVVSKDDIDRAKQATEKAVRESIAKNLANELKEGEILLEQAEKVSITKTGTNVKIGDMTDKFEYGATASIRAFVFLEKDIRDIIKNSIASQDKLKNTNWDVSKLEYGASVADFEKNMLELKIHSEIKIVPIIDTNKIKKDILGKKDDELGLILKNYTTIKSVNVEFQPTIVSRIPQYSSRVKVEVMENAE